MMWDTLYHINFRYSCQTGYTLDPPEWAVRTCGALGHWQGSVPICRREYVTNSTIGAIFGVFFVLFDTMYTKQ
jgi:hypothetical protein